MNCAECNGWNGSHWVGCSQASPESKAEWDRLVQIMRDGTWRTGFKHDQLSEIIKEERQP